MNTPPIVKAISLWQPWATLIAIGAKSFETRSWKTPHRGLLAIHASGNTENLTIIRQAPFANVLRNAKIFNPSELPLGSLLCLVNLVDIYPTDSMPPISAQERAFGDYSPGRYAWKLEVVRIFETPLRQKGMQGVWALQPGLAARVLREYQGVRP
jgi:hypothetical protein